MSSFSRDVRAARTGCGFGAFVSVGTFHCFALTDVKKVCWRSRVNQPQLSPRSSVNQIIFNCTFRCGPALPHPGLVLARTGRVATRSRSRKRSNPEVVGRVRIQLSARASCVSGASVQFSEARFLHTI